MKANVLVLPFFILLLASLSPFPPEASALNEQKPFFSIQIASYKELPQASKMADRFRRSGFNAFYRHETVPGKGKWYRVYIERYPSRKEAEREAERLKKEGRIPDFLIRQLRDEAEGKGVAERQKQVKPGTVANSGRPPMTRSPGKAPSSADPVGSGAAAPSVRKAANQSQGQNSAVQTSGDTADRSSPSLVIEDVAFKRDAQGKEKVFIHANRFFTPLVFALEGEKPRTVIDIPDTGTLKREISILPVDGALIKRIRAHHYATSKTLRIVLDHDPGRNYRVDQVFYEAQNIYAVVVEAAGVAGDKEPERSLDEKKEEALRTRSIPQNMLAGRFPLRHHAKNMEADDVRSMLIKHHFYSGCWNYNENFCNPDGSFDNLFIDNGNGTVTQVDTGLIWQKGVLAESLTWDEAQGQIEQLNRQAFAGSSDWRLPTIEELASLMEPSWKKGLSYIDAVFDRQQESCWSADTRGEERAWKSNYYSGYLIDAPKNDKNAARAVRSQRTVKGQE